VRRCLVRAMYLTATAATGNAVSPTVDRRVRRTSRDVDEAERSRHLDSASDCIPRCRRITFGRRAFSVEGPTVWNSLPTGFRSLSVGFGDFRRSVKTYDTVRAIFAHSAQ